jgi:hypothetical protein
VVGHVGSGTSEIAQALRDILSDATLAGGAFQVQILKARNVIRDWATQNGETLPDETARRLGGTIAFQNLGDKMRAQPTSSGEPDYPAVARGLVLRVRESRAKGLGQSVKGTDLLMPDGARRAYVLDMTVGFAASGPHRPAAGAYRLPHLPTRGRWAWA